MALIQNGPPARSASDPGRDTEMAARLNRHLSDSFLETNRSNNPKHRQLSDALISAITTGVVKEGQKLPNETQLTLMTPFSLGTVQKALKTLMQQGLIVRKPGLGSMVTDWRRSMAQPLHCRFATPTGEYFPVYPQLVRRQTMRTQGRWNDFLGTTARVVRIDRQIWISDLFAVLTRFHVDIDRFPLFAKAPVEDLETANFKLLISEQLRCPIVHMEHRLTLIHAPAEVAEHIAVPVDQPILHLAATATGQSGEAVYYLELFIPPNDLELCVDSRLDSIGGI